MDPPTESNPKPNLNPKPNTKHKPKPKPNPNPNLDPNCRFTISHKTKYLRSYICSVIPTYTGVYTRTNDHY